jgi:hypothetical protein
MIQYSISWRSENGATHRENFDTSPPNGSCGASGNGSLVYRGQPVWHERFDFPMRPHDCNAFTYVNQNIVLERPSRKHVDPAVIAAFGLKPALDGKTGLRAGRFSMAAFR